jgi:ribonucleoside-diphosphate reductase alpha chain
VNFIKSLLNLNHAFMTSSILTIIKRDKTVADFDPNKINTAIQKAFIEVKNGYDPEKVMEITKLVIEELEALFADSTPLVERVQDVVERQLMQQGYFDVAKSYILYRYEHSKQREEKVKETLEKIEQNALTIIKRSGKKENFSFEKLKRSLEYAVKGFEDVVDVDVVLNQCRSELYENIKTGDISRALIMTVRAMIEQDPAYSKVAARLLLFLNYKDSIGADVIDFTQLEKQYRAAFIQNIKRGVELERLDPKLLTFDLERLSKALVIERDDLFVYLGLQTLYDRYFLSDYKTKQVLETPQMFWMRIAMGAALNEKQYKNEWTIKFYDIMSLLLYTPSTPTLFHSGTHKPQLSSCYLNTVSDSLDNIFKTYADNSQLSKWSGGIGTDWTNIRGTGSYISGTGVESQGVIPFLKIANDVTVAINRSGRRRGAACVYLECWHYDVEDFLELRKNTGDERRRTHDMDTANWIPDLFMKRVREDGEWTLFSPDEVPDLHHIYGRKFEKKYAQYEKEAKEGKIKLFKLMKARDLWKKMLAMLFETGHPWITFKDPSNVRSPQDHIGVVHNSNLCTEITLNTSEDETAVCNLGSLNFAKFIVQGSYDEKLVAETVEIAMRMLDNIIDINYYPTEDARRSNMRHRPVGLGVRGFQDALYLLGIDFDSEACVEFADYSMEVVSYYAILASSKLAAERGSYESFRGSKWERGILPQDTLDLLESERGLKIDVKRGERLNWEVVRASIEENGMRNSNCLAVAPTATTANIVGCIPTVEPIYKNLYVKSNQAGDFIIINPYLVEDLKKLNLWDFEMLGKIKYFDGSIAQIMEIPEKIRNRYKEVFEINPKWIIKSAAYRGKWIDQSQSINIYFRGTSGKELSEVYMFAWEMGLKTTYYLRTLAASQVEKSTVDTKQFGSTHLRKQTVGENTFSTPTTSADEKAAPLAPPKACLITDPTCESCQA